MNIGLKTYDCSEKDNVKAFRALPEFYQLFMHQLQRKIHQMVLDENEGRELIRTSGWRSIEVNSFWGGVADSLHLIGCATDYRRKSGEPPLNVARGFVCIASGSDKYPVWHVQYLRG